MTQSTWSQRLQGAGRSSDHAATIDAPLVSTGPARTSFLLAVRLSSFPRWGVTWSLFRVPRRGGSGEAGPTPYPLRGPAFRALEFYLRVAVIPLAGPGSLAFPTRTCSSTPTTCGGGGGSQSRWGCCIGRWSATSRQWRRLGRRLDKERRRSDNGSSVAVAQPRFATATEQQLSDAA